VPAQLSALDGALSRGHAASPPSLQSDDSLLGPARPQPLRIAIMDSDSGFLVVLAKRLERLDWKHRVIASTPSPKKVAAMELDALILDLAGLGAKRWTWLERVCAAERSFNIIVCTGASTVVERVRGLRLGVDGWLSKPCHPEELIARVEAIAGRRHRSEPRSLEPITAGEVEIRHDQYQAFVDGASLGLTRKEFKLIELLSSAPNKIVKRELIYERLWGYRMARNDRSVDVFVHKLRRKLEQASPEWRYVHTHFGVGYRFAAEAIEVAHAPAELTSIEGAGEDGGRERSRERPGEARGVPARRREAARGRLAA
jgi:DNA-binding response OmpR family regulator